MQYDGIKDKVAIVTGSGGGIGEAYAKGLAAQGARVVVAEIKQDDGERVAAEIRDQRELLTLGLIGDCILSGNMAAAMDALMMRRHAVRTAKSVGGSWEKAQLAELIHDTKAPQAPAGVIQLGK